MMPSIFKRIAQATRILNGTVDLDQCIPISGEVVARVVRDGRVVREIVRKNIVVYQGLNRIAYRNANYGNTIAAYIGIGTQTAAHSLGTTQATIGELSRKAAITITQSHEYFTAVATWGGSADGISGVAFDTGFLTDYPNSAAGSGIIYNAANGLGVTLQNSDFLNLTISIRCGSHNVAQST